MYFYGLDISMANTGVTIVDVSKEVPEIVYIGSISTDTKEFKKLPIEYRHGKKLKFHYESIMKLIEKYPPSVAVIERGFSRFNNATQTLFRVHGVYNLAFADVENIYLVPKLVKDTIYTGNADKGEIATVLKRRLKVEFENEDESDSLAVAWSQLIIDKRVEWKPVRELTKKDKAKREKQVKRAKNVL